MYRGAKRDAIAARGGRAGLTTVELLVVMAIVGILVSVTVPVLLQGGLFAGRKAELGGRELFTMLKAAKIYATTYNMSTALAYSGRFIRDAATGENVPIADSYIIVRRVRQEDLEHPEFETLRQELLVNPNYSISDGIYVPVSAAEGSFTRLGNEVCILPDLFEVETLGATVYSTKGLRDIAIWDHVNNFFYGPRGNFEYGLKSTSPIGSFPAHVFLTSGALEVSSNLRRQRFTIRVGLLPDAENGDRFTEDPQIATTNGIAVGKLFSVAIDRNAILPYTTFILGTNLNDPEADELDIDMDLELYPAQGRVKVKR